jgi:acyl-coenzyme A synthetase/AMP-(fatty) acid ligase
VVFVDELPRLPSGKLAKRMLSDDIRGLTPA